MFESSGTESWELASGRVVDVPVARPLFEPWRGVPITHTYGNKALCDLDGAPVFAELVIVHSLRQDGWDAVWADTYRRRYWQAMPIVSEPVDLPEAPARLVADLTTRAGRRGGVWDVLAWRNGSFRFVEAKRRSRDRVQPAQRAFLDAALDAGQPIEAFLLATWDLR